jgi:endonuclease YncB( thermonuclease family)
VHERIVKKICPKTIGRTVVFAVFFLHLFALLTGCFFNSAGTAKKAKEEITPAVTPAENITSDRKTVQGDLPVIYDVPESLKGRRPDTGATRVKAHVERVVDGDTLIVLLDGVRERLRLIGIDAPESSSNPDEARQTPEGDIVSTLVSDLITGGTVYLEFDQSERDRYDRLLAYVWLSDDTMLNECLVYSGLANVVCIAPNTACCSYFRLLQSEAKRLGLGFR